jgi:hypothetical protein
VIKYQLVCGITVELDTDEPDVSAPYKLIAPDQILEIFFEAIVADLMMGWGFHGHSVGETAATAMCLKGSMNSPRMARWEPELIEGAEVFAKYKPDPLPPGMVH